MKEKINFLTLSYCKQTVTILAKFSLELFLFKKENLQQNIPSSKSPPKKLQRKKERKQEAKFLLFFFGCELSQKNWKILSNFFLKNVSSTKIARLKLLEI